MMIVFGHGKPGSVRFAPEGTTVEFTLESIVLDRDVGIMIGRGYYHLGGDSILPVQVPVGDPPPSIGKKLYIACPDAPGSENITVLIEPDMKYTEFAGLLWLDKTRINVWEDGTVEVHREGVRAVDADKTLWVSKQIAGEINAFVMVMDK